MSPRAWWRFRCSYCCHFDHQCSVEFSMPPLIWSADCPIIWTGAGDHVWWMALFKNGTHVNQVYVWPSLVSAVVFKMIGATSDVRLAGRHLRGRDIIWADYCFENNRWPWSGLHEVKSPKCTPRCKLSSISAQCDLVYDSIHNHEFASWRPFGCQPIQKCRCALVWTDCWALGFVNSDLIVACDSNLSDNSLGSLESTSTIFMLVAKRYRHGSIFSYVDMHNVWILSWILETKLDPE